MLRKTDGRGYSSRFPPFYRPAHIPAHTYTHTHKKTWHFFSYELYLRHVTMANSLRMELTVEFPITNITPIISRNWKRQYNDTNWVWWADRIRLIKAPFSNIKWVICLVFHEYGYLHDRPSRLCVYMLYQYLVIWCRFRFRIKLFSNQLCFTCESTAVKRETSRLLWS